MALKTNTPEGLLPVTFPVVGVYFPDVKGSNTWSNVELVICCILYIIAPITILPTHSVEKPGPLPIKTSLLPVSIV